MYKIECFSREIKKKNCPRFAETSFRKSLSFLLFLYRTLLLRTYCLCNSPQWGDTDAEIKVPSGENTELNRSPFKVWSRSVYGHTLLHLLPWISSSLISTLPIHSPPFFFFQNLSRFFLCWLWLTHGSCVGPQNEIGHPAGGRFPC